MARFAVFERIKLHQIFKAASILPSRLTQAFVSFSLKSLARFLLILNFVGCSDITKGTFLVPHFCVPIDYKRTNLFYKVGTKHSLWGKRRTFCSELLSVNGTHCSQISQLGLFCSEFLSVNGTHCSKLVN